MVAFLEKLWDTVFGKKHVSDAANESRRINELSIRHSGNGQETVPAVSMPEPPLRKEPYFVQIGFDFGTAFCKCVCRDVMSDHAWVHVPKDNNNVVLPFLISSSVIFDNGALSRANSSSETYRSGMLQHVKMALQKIGLGQWDDMVLKSYRQAIPNSTNEEVQRLVETCAIYLLAGVLGGVKSEIADRFPGKVKDDYIAVNMAVPVADANQQAVSAIFDRILRYAWVLTDDLYTKSNISLKELEQLCKQKDDPANSEQVKNACLSYPEVSANVQAFVRSRTSGEGIYLFSDTGAGTVDQSLFIFHRPDSVEHLTYLFAEVFPLGSNRLEWLAAEKEGNVSWENLEKWRIRKEANENSGELGRARKELGEQLGRATKRVVASAARKLPRPQQMNGLRVVFGGGGHCRDPYRSAVMNQFDGPVFGHTDIRSRRSQNDPFETSMPQPKDLKLEDNQRRWMDRLTVAYGLSFEREDLVNFTLPNDVGTPTPAQILRRSRYVTPAPSKDEV